MTRLALLLSVAVLSFPASAGATEAPPDARAYIISPRDGARVRSPFTIRFGLRGMGVTHAGDPTKNLGHHHLLVDAGEPLDPREPIPSDRQHLHFGAGQTETDLDLPPGPHTLQIVLGDADHKLFTPDVASAPVSLTVVPANEPLRQVRRDRRKRHSARSAHR
jgi:hypothetical protein